MNYHINNANAFSNLRDIVVPFEDLGDAKPSIEQTSECGAQVTTYSQPQVSNTGM